ncbi:MAG: TAXI family TRAP transporter solute-binding subunit [Desulfobacula sp.]|jgi:hypothetical protein
MDEYKGYFHYILLIVFFLFINRIEGFTRENKIFRIGTGGKTGVYYPVGRLIAQGVTGVTTEKNTSEPRESGVPGLIGVAQNSAGSVENIKTIISGEIEAGFVQADDAANAFHATGPFAGKTEFKDIRALASLYPEKLHIAVRKDAGIKTVNDLKGKRMAVDEPGSGTLLVTRIILKAHGMTEKDFFPIYLKPVFTEEKIISGDLHGFVIMAGTPVDAVTKLIISGISLVPIDRNIAEKIHQAYPYLIPGVIPSQVYPDIPDIPTIEVYALLAVRKDMDEALVYRITASLWSPETLNLIKQGHPKGNTIALENALTGLSIPLHEGAKRFYRKKGMQIKEDK